MFRKLYEMGYVPIPIFQGGKNPAIKSDWTRWCREKPPEDLIDEWDEQYVKRGWNLGITCGPASGIVVVDIDTDDPSVLDRCPPSSVRRRGKKGEARVFRYREGIKSQSLPGLDILADGRQFLIPPSIHPDTKKPYVWLTPDTLENTKPEDLPELDLGFLSTFSSSAILEFKGKGRNSKLVDLVSAMRGRGEPEAKIVKEVYEWDLLYHSPRLFNDASEGFKAKDEQEAQRNAWGFVINVSKSLIRSGLILLENEKVVVQISDVEEKRLIAQFEEKEYPEPTGLIKDIRDLILSYSERNMPNIALGGAVALMSTICSNRFRFDQCWPNTFVLNLAPTGAGKSFPQKIISVILDERLETSLIGFGNYQSSSAFSKNLVSKRERLDMIDEVSSLFAQLKGGGLWQMGILEEMCKVWSSSSGKYNAAEYADKADTSSCFNPCVNVLGSSTIEGMRSQITKMMVTKGLLPRFLIFSHEGYGKVKPDTLDEDLMKKVTNSVSNILKNPKRINDSVAFAPGVLTGPVYNPIDLAPLEKPARELFNVIRAEFHARVESEESQNMKDMLTRAKEQTMKLALLHAVGNTVRRITEADLLWAKLTFEVCLHNSKAFIEEGAVDSDWEKDVQAVVSLFQKNQFVSVKLIGDRLRRLQPQRVKAILDHLLTTEKVTHASRENKGHRRSGFTLTQVEI